MVRLSQGSNISISRTCILKSSLEKFCLTRSLASLFDSSKSSVHIRIAPFLPQEITIINYSTLHQKQTLSICIYPLGIDTDLVTYPIDARRRRRSIPVLSHIPRGRTQAPRSRSHAMWCQLPHLGYGYHIASLFSRSLCKSVPWVYIVLDRVREERIRPDLDAFSSSLMI